MKKIARVYTADDITNDLPYLLLKKTKERDLQILTAHLLAERILISYLNRSFPNPKALHNSRFSFINILALAKAFNNVTDKPWLWDCLSKLNDLRNELVHDIQSDSFTAKLNTFILSTNLSIDVDNVSKEEQFVSRLLILLKVTADHLLLEQKP